MSDFTVYPAIDLRQGRVVRLTRGDPERETSYADDPLSVARRWEEAGAEWLHVVNLDGALGGRGQKNHAALERILSMGLQVQFGGGLRDRKTLRRVFDLGVARAVIGTAAVEDPPLVQAALDVFGPQRIAVAIDAREERVRTHGWKHAAQMTPIELAQMWAEKGIRRVIFTDVGRDGVGSGLNLEATVRLAQGTGLNVIASGGVAGLEDVRRAHDAGLSGVIIGRALYEREVTLKDALQIGQSEGGEYG